MKTTRRLTLIAGAALCIALSGVGQVRAGHYSGWRYHPPAGYYYSVYTYRPGRYHYAIYYPERPRYVYYFDPARRAYWGRFDLEGRPGRQYSVLSERHRRLKVSDIADEAYSPPGPLPRIPGENLVLAPPPRVPVLPAELPPRDPELAPEPAPPAPEDSPARHFRSGDSHRTGSRRLPPGGVRRYVAFLPPDPQPPQDAASEGLPEFRNATRDRDAVFQVLLFEELPDGRPERGGAAVDRAGASVAAAIAAQLHAWGFRVAVAWDDLPDGLRERLKADPEIDLEQVELVAVFSGEVRFQVGHQRQADGRDRTTARIDLSVTVEARTSQAKRTVYERTLQDRETVDAPGLAGRAGRSRQAAAAVLQRSVERILTDPELEAGLLDALP